MIYKIRLYLKGLLYFVVWRIKNYNIECSPLIMCDGTIKLRMDSKASANFEQKLRVDGPCYCNVVGGGKIVNRGKVLF